MGKECEDALIDGQVHFRIQQKSGVNNGLGARNRDVGLQDSGYWVVGSVLSVACFLQARIQ